MQPKKGRLAHYLANNRSLEKAQADLTQFCQKHLSGLGGVFKALEGMSQLSFADWLLRGLHPIFSTSPVPFSWTPALIFVFQA